MEIGTLSEQVREIGRYLVEHGLAWGNAGNISIRAPQNHLVITASGTRLGALGVNDIVAVSLDRDGPADTRGGHKPSKELPMHLAVYTIRPEINAIIHATPLYSTLVACTDLEVPNDLFVEDMYYLERVRRVAYCHPGTDALARAVEAAAASANVLLLENHGVLVYDTSLDDARTALEALELTCRMLLMSRAASVALSTLAPDVVHDFLCHSGYRARRNWGSA